MMRMNESQVRHLMISFGDISIVVRPQRGHWLVVIKIS